MNLYVKFKYFFLFAIFTLFSYRIALLHHQEELLSLYQNQLPNGDLSNIDYNNKTVFMLMLAESIQNDSQKKQSSPNENHINATKYNTQLEHYAYMVTRLIEKNKCNEPALRKIEQELVTLEKTVQALGIAALINQSLVKTIKESILYLRMLDSKQREKANKI
jgi:hypothetical protein